MICSVACVPYIIPLKVSPQLKFFTYLVSDHFTKNPTYLVSAMTRQLICTDLLFSVTEMTRQTITFFFNGSGKKCAKTKSGPAVRSMTSSYSYFHKLPDFTIKVYCFDDF